MNKKIIIVLVIIILVILVGVIYFLTPKEIEQEIDENGCIISEQESWCGFKNKCIKQGESCDLTEDWILKEANKIIGLDLNVMPNQAVEWKVESGEVAFSGKGIYYTDLLKSEKIAKTFEDWEMFLKEIGLESNDYNPDIMEGKKSIKKYGNEKIVCELKKINNLNETSSLALYCANKDNEFCNFNSSCGRQCDNDSDCGLAIDGCAKKSVCRNKNYKFYQDCDIPTATVKDISTSISECICLDNQCLPKKEEFRDRN
ncbi:MAG: hypothetical protein ABH956_01275 [Candidatus Nealsonbacteria bacterium]